jgi:hypothetical protein
MIWEDKQDVCIVTDVHKSPAEGNSCDERTIAIVEDCIQHMGCVDKWDRMANIYSVSWRTWKWTKKLFFYLNSYISLTYCGKKVDHQKCCLTFVQHLFEMSAREP